MRAGLEVICVYIAGGKWSVKMCMSLGEVVPARQGHDQVERLNVMGNEDILATDGGNRCNSQITGKRAYGGRVVLC